MSSMRTRKKTMRSLRLAITKRNAQQIREALRSRPNLKTPEGGRLLWSVIDNPEMATMLVLAGADLSVRNPTDQTSFLLWLAARVNVDEQYLRLALLMLGRGANVNNRTRLGNTALHLAVKNESLMLVDALVKKGLSVDISNVRDETAVCLAAKCSRAREMLRLLVDQQPLDANKTRNRQILNAIQFFICSESDESVAIKELLDLGVDVNEAMDCGLTPLSLAVARGKSSVLELLMERGSDISKLMTQRDLPIIRASYMEQSLILNLLLDKGAGVNARDAYGRNRLHIVCACSKFMPLRNVQLLLHLGADVNAFDKWGNTPFSLMDTETLGDARQLYIKHLALLFWKGAVVSETDMIIMRNDLNANKFYEDCLDELQRMKATSMYEDFSVFDFFVKSLDVVSVLARSPDFVASYNDKKWLFPMYQKDLEHIFSMAEIRGDMLRATEKIVNSATGGVLPVRAIERIAYYVCSDRLGKLERDFYFMLHARANTKKLFGNDDMVVD